MKFSKVIILNILTEKYHTVNRLCRDGKVFSHLQNHKETNKNRNCFSRLGIPVLDIIAEKIRRAEDGEMLQSPEREKWAIFLIPTPPKGKWKKKPVYFSFPLNPFPQAPLLTSTLSNMEVKNRERKKGKGTEMMIKKGKTGTEKG